MRTHRPAAVVLALLASAAVCGATDVARVLNLVVAPRDAASGMPTTGPVTLTLSLYDAPTGGTLLWSETKSVPVTRGIATVTLGDTVPLSPAGLTFNQAYWLGVKVNADPEMTPRIALTPAPYTLGLVLPLTARAPVPGASTFSIYNTGAHGSAILGDASNGHNAIGVEGRSAGTGVVGRGGNSTAALPPVWMGVFGTSDVGVYGLGGAYGAIGHTDAADSTGVAGECTSGSAALGVLGRSAPGTGIRGEGRIGAQGVSTADSGQGVIGEAMTGGGTGVLGKASLSLGIGVFGSGAYGVRGEGPVGVKGFSTGTNGTGVSGEADNGTNADGVMGHSSQGHGVHGSSDSQNGVYAYSQGSGAENAALKAINDLPNTGMAAYLWNQSTYATAHLQNKGTGEVLVLQTGAGANRDFIRAVDQSWDAKFRVNPAGEVYADGTFHPGGADFAEMLPGVEGLEPGDVLVIGPDGRLTKSAEAYQTALAGVYSTRPGVLGGSSDERFDAGKVPLAVVGVVPVKVCGEGGVIVPGDVLTTSARPGHAMKATDRTRWPGAVLGKALEAFPGTGEGVIKVLVNVR
jgi:hypothetical protein